MPSCNDQASTGGAKRISQSQWLRCAVLEQRTVYWLSGWRPCSSALLHVLSDCLRSTTTLIEVRYSLCLQPYWIRNSSLCLKMMLVAAIERMSDVAGAQSILIFMYPATPSYIFGAELRCVAQRHSRQPARPVLYSHAATGAGLQTATRR
jgi:hypothetical protein